MVWILILILSHPVLVKPTLSTMVVYPQLFYSKVDCQNKANIEVKKSSVILGYCQEIEPVMVK